MALTPESGMPQGGRSVHLLIRCVSWEQFQPVLEKAVQRQAGETVLVVENNSENPDRYPDSVQVKHYEGDFFEAAQLGRQLADVIKSGVSRLTIPMMNAWGIRYGELLEFANTLSDASISLVTIDDLQTHALEDVNARYSRAQAVLERSRKQLKELGGAFKGKRCFVLGNAKSLNSLDLSRLKDEQTFGVNGVFHGMERMGGMTTFYTVEDDLFIERNAELLRQLPARYRFYPLDYLPILGEGDSTIYLEWQPASRHTRLFSMDSSERVYCGYSAVFINLQLAWYMGFDPVYIIGIDLDYDLGSKERTEVLVAGSGEGDHFHTGYHQEGLRWYRPKVDEMYRSLQMAKEVFEAGGRTIYKASPGGNLDLFAEVDYDGLF